MVLVHSVSAQDGTGGRLTLQKLFEHIKHSLCIASVRRMLNYVIFKTLLDPMR